MISYLVEVCVFTIKYFLFNSYALFTIVPNIAKEVSFLSMSLFGYANVTIINNTSQFIQGVYL